MKKDNNTKSKFKWLWEFSKKLVVICSLLYVFGFLYTCTVMWRFSDFTHLGTFIEQYSDILRTCVFGYFVKAGFENIIKIRAETKACCPSNTPNEYEHNAPLMEQEREIYEN
jgi:hypothetical protein